MLLHITFWLDKYQMNIVNNDNVDLVDYQKLYKHITYLCFFLLCSIRLTCLWSNSYLVHMNVYDKSQPYIIRHPKEKKVIYHNMKERI